MSFEPVWSPKSQKALAKLGKDIVARITAKVAEAAGSPYEFLEKIRAEEGYKLRVGDYRVIIDLDKDRRALHILTIRHRRNAYKV